MSFDITQYHLGTVPELSQPTLVPHGDDVDPKPGYAGRAVMGAGGHFVSLVVSEGRSFTAAGASSYSIGSGK